MNRYDVQIHDRVLYENPYTLAKLEGFIIMKHHDMCEIQTKRGNKIKIFYNSIVRVIK